MCTIEGCKDAATLFSHSSTWAQHEASQPSPALRSSECVFCSAIYQHEGPAYYRHVSAHLREVSLSVLPQAADDDDGGFDSDDSQPLSSASDSVHVIPGALNVGEAGTRVAPAAGEAAEPGSTLGPESGAASSSKAAAGGASGQTEVDLDSIIDRLLEVRGSRPGKMVHLLEVEIRYLCTRAREIFISQPILLELAAPLVVR